MKCITAGAVWCLLFAGIVLAQGQAYEFQGQQLFANRPSHWRNWTVQNSMVRDLTSLVDSSGLFDISAAGIKPKYFQGIQNYVLDVEQFKYADNVRSGGAVVQGGISALSNNELASLVGDGDLETYWEPAAADFSIDGLRNWQILIDLGQAVWADSIVVFLPPVQAGGTIPVPIVSLDANTAGDLSPETQDALKAFSRRAALDSVVATQTLVSETGDTLVREGQVLVPSGVRLPANLDQVRLLNQLGITAIAVQGEEDLGDAPKLFAVEVSMGKQAGDTSSKNYRFDAVGRAAEVGNQRRLAFRLEPLDKADYDGDGTPDISGTFVHFVRLTIFDSDLDQQEFLGEGEEGRLAYQSLSPQRQGRRVFQRLSAGGFVKRINPILDNGGKVVKTEEVLYNELPAAEKGEIRYFRRELPRVTEVQVWGQGPNLAYKPERRAGGSFEDGGRGSPNLATDGLYLTKWVGNAWDIKYSSGSGQDQLVCCTMWLDLGATFWIDKVRIGNMTTQETSTEGAPFGLHLLGSDGTTLKPLKLNNLADFYNLEFGLAWSDLVNEVHKNNWDFFNRITGEEFGKRRLRFFQVRNDDPTGEVSGNYSAPGNFNEIQMFGEGYPAETSFSSPPIILLPGVREDDAGKVKERQVLAQIHWETEAVVHRTEPLTGQNLEVAEPLELHPEVQLQIQTRTTDTIDSLVSYFVISGQGTVSELKEEVDQSEYEALTALWDEYNTWNALPASRTIRLQPHKTGRDDDGDGKVDEDLIDGVDNDGDNLIDEDGLTGDGGGPNSRGTFTLTKHDRNKDDDSDGAVDEDAIDGVDNDKDNLIDEDGKKKAAPRQIAQMTATPFFAGWSPWSESYRPTGGENRALITSPSPRKFLQIRVNMVSADPEVTARIKFIRVDLAPPISSEMAGELAVRTAQGLERTARDLGALPDDYAPPVEIPPLANQDFSYFLRAAGPDPNAIGVADGFDEFLLLTPGVAQLTSVRLGEVVVAEVASNIELGATLKIARSSRFTRSFTLTPGDSLLRDGSGASLRVRSRGDSLLIHFPTSLNQGFGETRNALVEVQFKTQPLKAGTDFIGSVRNSNAKDGVFQRIESEGPDATELVNSHTSRPTILHTGEIISGVTVAPVFTPNGDGVNDQLEIQLAVLSLREDRPLAVGIYDLAGRLVAQVRPVSGSSQAQVGIFSYAWDGRDAVGDLVAPGIYVCRISLETDSGEVRAIRVVSVAY
ncbi:MAG: hypothetical protein IT369_08795 [Candidatus Latescibacteria bacterium]|nr:hypothetical protein [Candidatus Latescibacterota bacterium]